MFQHYAATNELHRQTARVGLLVTLARQPVWLAGVGLDCAGYLLQFLALRRGSLSLVEPLLVVSLVVALPIAARLEHCRISLQTLVSALAIVVGLGLFLGAARPGVGNPHASAMSWIVLSGVLAVVCGATALCSVAMARPQAAVLLAAGAGAAFGYVAALTERTGHLLDAGLVHTLSNWEPYALVGAGVIALHLTQESFRAGALRLSLPTLTVSQPLVAIAIGLTVFGERIDTDAAALGLELAGLVLIAAGSFVAAQSPLITELEVGEAARVEGDH